MIKVNLKETKTASSIYTKTGTGAYENEDFKTAVGTIVKEWFEIDFKMLNPFIFLSILIKLILIAGFPIGLYIYEARVIGQLEERLESLGQKHTSLQKSLSDLKVKIESNGHLKDKSKEYDNKKEFLKGLAYSRLIVPQLLDQVQSIIPESVWLKTITVSTKEEGDLKIVGESLGEDRVNLFADSLKVIVERDSIKVNMTDVEENNNFVKVKFTLTALLLKRRSF